MSKEEKQKLELRNVDAFALIQAIAIAQEVKMAEKRIDPEPAIEALEEAEWQAE